MADALEKDPLYGCFIPDEEKRKAFLNGFMTFRVKYGRRAGKVFVTDDCMGVAIWLRPGRKMSPLDVLLCGGFGAMKACSKEERDRLMGFNDYADKVGEEHCSGPCWHLSPICVAPESQGKGRGTALLEHGFAFMAKEDPKPCYLETQTERNRDFYAKRGFRTVVETTVPATDIPHFGMVREA